MGSQIIKQSDGLYSIFSSNTDTITVYDATEQDIEDYFVDRAAEAERRRIHAILEHVIADEPRKAYHQFAKTWAEALESDRIHDGEVWQLKLA